MNSRSKAEIRSPLKVLSGFAFPSSGFCGPDEGIPLVRIRDINSLSTEVNFKGQFDKTYLLADGDVIVGMDGDFNVVTWNGGAALLNQRVCKVVADEDVINQRFLYHFLQPQLDVIHRRTPQTTVRHLSTGALLRIKFPNFTVSEQQRIAEILDTLDAQICTIEQVIAKLISAQEGLVVDLLTCGIDESGALRNAARGSGQFHDSPIGQVPVGWDVAPLSAYRHPQRPYLKTGPFGSSLKQEHWVDEGVPVVTIGSLGNGVFIDTELLYISETTAGALSSYALSPGDIVFSRVADVGRSVVIKEREKNWIMSSNMMWISVDPSRADSRFVRANIATNPNLRSQIRRYVNSAGRDVANAKIMNLLQFPWPPLKEQVAIADRIAISDERITTERSRAAKLYAYKDGLMTDLLTGRVPVPLEAVK